MFLQTFKEADHNMKVRISVDYFDPYNPLMTSNPI